jgi:glycine amidinotransferase/scyllo-inosamine-4-phosphate amidinotransferase 1
MLDNTAATKINDFTSPSGSEVGKINSHNEWDKLIEVIVGTAEGTMAVLTWPRPEPIPEWIKEKAYKLAKEAYPQWFLDEVGEDLNGLCAALKQSGVKVHRPRVHDLTKMYSSPGWCSTGNNIYNVRDLHLVVGNNVIESPSQLKSRYFEATALYHIWYQYFKKGCRWISGPKPRLTGDVILSYYRDESERVLTEEDIRYKELTGGRLEKLHKLSEEEILFEAANTARMGRDLLYLVSSSGNYMGAKWLQSVLGDEFRVHTTEDIYRSSHIDSTVLCLRPGLVLLNSCRVNEKNCPKIFDKWDKIYFGDVAPTSNEELDFQKNVRDRIANELAELGFETNLKDMASPWVGMNLLSVDPETVIVDSRQANLIRLLEGYKFTVIPVRMRHIYTQGGGLHCATLDTVRDSKLESYFD